MKIGNQCNTTLVLILANVDAKRENSFFKTLLNQLLGINKKNKLDHDSLLRI